jgi:hypothetical protein
MGIIEMGEMGQRSFQEGRTKEETSFGTDREEAEAKAKEEFRNL